MTDKPPRSAPEVEKAAWICLEAMLPTDPVQMASNMLGLNDALADWTAADLRQLVGTLAGMAAHFYRALEAKHQQ